MLPFAYQGSVHSQLFKLCCCLTKVVITSSWARLAVKKVYIWCFTGPVLVSLSKNVVLVMIGFIIS